MSYRDELWRELTAVGITGGLRSRIVAEIEDHLACDPGAELGAPAALAAQFADELGTSRARRAGGRSFAALALAGILFGVTFVAAPGGLFRAISAHTTWLGTLAAIVATVGAQVALVAGALAVCRVLRRRRAAVMPSAEATIVLRRGAVGVAAGIATMAALGLAAVELRHAQPGWWVTLAEVAAAVGIAGLAAAVPSLMASLRVRPVATGSAGDLFDDIGQLLPHTLHGRPWRLALLVSAGVAVVIALAGVATADPFDGIARGLADGLLCLLGFATLGRYLGLWRPAVAG